MAIAAISTRRSNRHHRTLFSGSTRGSIGFVSTYPPTKCGLATFTRSLARALGMSASTGIVRCVDEPGAGPYPHGVVGEWVRDSPASLEAAAATLNTFDAVVIQHEFGIFGGRDGNEVLALVELLEVPVTIVLHTVLPEPSAHQRSIIERLAATAHRVVAQSGVARARLLKGHDVDPGSVVVIQHGAPANFVSEALPRSPGRRPTILTWGLLGPGKGIEYAIDALAKLRDLDPLPRYVVLGETHPTIVRDTGESYRESLVARAEARGVRDLVRFDDGYRETAEILAEVRRADIVLLPYLSRDQVVSGVLVEAIASAKPVVSTAFPHAVELLGQGSGIVVPHEDPGAITAALKTLLTDSAAAARAAAVACEQAASHTWENVGRRYRRLTRELQRNQAVNAS